MTMRREMTMIGLCLTASALLAAIEPVAPVGGETVVDMTSSPLVEAVKFIWHSSSSCRGIFRDEGKKVMAENFREIMLEAK